MKHFNISAAVKSAQKQVTRLGRMLNEHRPEFLAASGICGYIASLYLMYKHADEIHEAVEEKDVKKIVKASLPVAGTAVLSTVAVLGSVKEGNKRYAAMSAAYSLTDAAFTEYRDSVKDILGEKKEKDVGHNSIDKEIQRIPPTDSTIIDTGHGSTLFYERLTGRYFKSDINFVKAAVNEANEAFDNGEDEFQLSDLYYLMDLEETEMSRNLGWSVDYGRIRVDQSPHLAPDGTPCIAIGYRNMGFLDYNGSRTFAPLDIFY